MEPTRGMGMVINLNLMGPTRGMGMVINLNLMGPTRGMGMVINLNLGISLLLSGTDSGNGNGN
jgi:hypothetical protein